MNIGETGLRGGGGDTFTRADALYGREVCIGVVLVSKSLIAIVCGFNRKLVLGAWHGEEVVEVGEAVRGRGQKPRLRNANSFMITWHPSLFIPPLALANIPSFLSTILPGINRWRTISLPKFKSRKFAGINSARTSPGCSTLSSTWCIVHGRWIRPLHA